jgi:TMEM175 potassium channel family protein
VSGHRSPTQAQQKELDRVGAFSDGVFAIAITLLVLNVEVPKVPEGQLADALSKLNNDLSAYAIGFAVMGLFWYGHHKLFSRLDRSNGRLVLANMVLLALIALMPFTTAVLGDYDEPLAVALYAANVGLASLLDGVTEMIAIHDGLEGESSRDAERDERTALVDAVVRAGIFFVSIPVAYGVSESLAKWMWLLLIVFARMRHRGRATPSR